MVTVNNQNQKKFLQSIQSLPKYKSQIKLLTKWLGQDKPFNKDTIFDYLKYRNEEQGVSIGTLNMDIAGIKYALKWAIEKERCSIEPTVLYQLEKFIEDLKLGKKASVAIDKEKMPTHDDVKKMLLYSSEREKCFIEFLYQTGARVSEMLNVRLSDIEDGANGKCIVRLKGKGKRLTVDNEDLSLGKEREVKVDKSLIEKIKSVFEGETFLFETRGATRKPYHRGYVLNRIKRIAEKANIGKRITPHLFRHAWALRAYKAQVNGQRVPINAISSYLGHSDPGTTLRLYGNERLSDEQLDAINER